MAKLSDIVKQADALLKSYRPGSYKPTLASSGSHTIANKPGLHLEQTAHGKKWKRDEVAPSKAPKTVPYRRSSHDEIGAGKSKTVQMKGEIGTWSFHALSVGYTADYGTVKITRTGNSTFDVRIGNSPAKSVSNVDDGVKYIKEQSPSVTEHKESAKSSAQIKRGHDLSSITKEADALLKALRSE